MPKIQTKDLLRPWFLATVGCLLYGIIVTNLFGTSLALVTLGSEFAPNSLADHSYTAEGYDGQFVYYITRYGFGAEPLLDVPAYRMQRVLLSVTGKIIALDQTTILQWGIFFAALFGVAYGTLTLERLLKRFQVSQWYAAGYAFSLGIFGGARLSTTEPLAYGLALGGIYYFERGRWMVGSLLFALAALTKETTLIFAAAYLLHLLFQQRKLWRTLLAGFVILFPFVWWQLVLYVELGEFGIGSGGSGATPFEYIPLGGFFRIGIEGGPQVFAALAPLIILFALAPTIWGLRQCMHDYQDKVWTIWTTFLFFNVVLMLFVPFSTYRELLGILRFIVGLQIAVILYAAATRRKRILRWSTFWSLTTILIVYSDYAIASSAG